MKKPINWRSLALTLLFVLINIIAIVATAVSEFGNTKNAAELATVKIQAWFLIPAAGCFVLAIGLEIIKYVLMMRKMRKNKEKADEQNKLSTDNKQYRHDVAVAGHTVLLGHYYDCFTPASIGGQPFQILYMHKHSGLPRGAATAVPVCGMISAQIGFLIVAIICFIFGNVDNGNPVLLVPAWIGLAFYAFWPILLVATSLWPKFTSRFLAFWVKLGAKIHLVKKPDEVLLKIEAEVKSYAKSVKLILRSRGLFAKVLVLSIIFQVLIASIPWFVLTAFGGEINYFECLATTMAVMSAVCFVPTPGNAGAAEGTFFVVFSALSEGYVFWAMLIWRFFSYYIYIIMGPITYLVMHIERKRGIID